MKKRLLFILTLFFVFVACNKNKKDDRYIITKDRIGKLTKDTQVSELDSIFKNDSIVNKEPSGEFSSRNEIYIYKKGGEEMLRLKPKAAFEESSKISRIRVMDTIFKTEEGIGLNSNFKDIKKHYEISRVENTLRNGMVFIDELNFYGDVDKKDIDEPTDMEAEIKPAQIKDNAKMKRLWIEWK